MKKLTDYEIYLKTEELLSLQKSVEQMASPDEMLFQVVHQSSELWMKLILHEFQNIKKNLEHSKLIQAHILMKRCEDTLVLLGTQLRILNTMSPNEYHKVRTQLGRGSGQESPGFNQILKEAPTLWPYFEKILSKRNITVLGLHENPEAQPDLFMLAEDLFSLDEQFLNFRYLHLQLVKRIIGGDVPSLKGVHAEKYLSHGLAENFYPELWRVRNQISQNRGIPIGAKRGLHEGT